MNNKKIAENIKSLRLKKGLSQSELAKICNLTSQAVSKWERAESIPDISTLENLSTLFGVTINDIINSDLVIKQNSLKSLDVIFLTVLTYVCIVFIFPFNAVGESISGYGVVFKGFDGDLVFSLRLSFFGYISMILVTLLTITNVFKKSHATLYLNMFLIIVTVISNGVAVNQSLVSVEAISFLVGGSLLLLILNVFEILRNLFVSGNNINSVKTKKFTGYVVLFMLILYAFASGYFHFYANIYQYDVAWWGYIAVGSVGISILIYFLSLIFRKDNLVIDLITLLTPMLGILITYLVYMLFIDNHVGYDDFLIVLGVEILLTIPLLLVIYKRKY